MIGTFNVGDLVGRFIPFCEAAVITRVSVLWVLTVVRYVVSIPVILIMAYGFVESDILAFTTVFILYVAGSFASAFVVL